MTQTELDVPFSDGEHNQEREYWYKRIVRHFPDLANHPSALYGDNRLLYYRLINEGLIAEVPEYDPQSLEAFVSRVTGSAIETSDYTRRLKYLEVMGKVAPGTLSDANMALHASQSNSLFNKEMDYKYSGLGITVKGLTGKGNETSKIQETLNSVSAFGASVVLPPGDFYVSGLVMKDAHLRGSGRGQTRIHTASDAAPGVATLTLDHQFEFMSLTDIHFLGNNKPNRMIHILNAQRLSISRLSLRGGPGSGDGLVIEGDRNTGNYTHAGHFNDIFITAFEGIAVDLNYQGFDTQWSNIWIATSGVGLKMRPGNGDTFWTNLHIWECTTNWEVFSDNNKFTNFYTESAYEYGLDLTGSNNQFINGRVWKNNSRNLKTTAIKWGGTANTFAYTKLQDNYGIPIEISQAFYWVIDNCRFFGQNSSGPAIKSRNSNHGSIVGGTVALDSTFGAWPFDITDDNMWIDPSTIISTSKLRTNPFAENLVYNPDFEVDLTGWASSNSTVIRDTSEKLFGSASAKITTDGANSGQGIQALPSGIYASSRSGIHTATAWVKFPVGTQIRIAIEQYNNDSWESTGPFSVFTATGDWQLINARHTLNASNRKPRVFIRTHTAVALTFNVSSVSIYQGTTLREPFSGSTGGWWLGNPNSSRSRINVLSL